MNPDTFPPMIQAYGVVEAIVAIVIAAATTYAQYSASQRAAQKQAAQAQLNANADAAAADAAARQQAEEQAAAARAKIAEQKRFRQQQIAAISGQGIQFTGTPLDILADTEVQNQQDLSNLAYSGQVAQRDIAHQRSSALAAGQQNAALALSNGPNKAATILSGASQVAGIYGNYRANTPTTAK